ncbi:hypothetical protein KQI36_16970 [Clostridium senegalense]|uniref:hypothetical protein n=1 Tax=Clostridium senegalense TaxID=1465809 RepID=UPI001C1186C5|nr:hypothetical protein [Clostridium senegalense]MBU5228312.1 hypothetical protein [Clostridium senegalense]
MNKIKEFTNSERNYYKDLYTELILSIDNISELLDEDDYNSRFFIKKVHIIKDYLDRLDDADYKADKKDFFDFLKSDEKYKTEVLDYKSTIINDLKKLELCRKCKCLKCVSSCSFKKCLNCLPSYYVHNCNKTDNCITKGLNTITLYSNDEERDVNFEPLGLLEELKENKYYIYLVENNNRNNQHILEYVKYLNGEVEYLPITKEDLDKIYDSFVKLNCYE